MHFNVWLPYLYLVTVFIWQNAIINYVVYKCWKREQKQIASHTFFNDVIAISCRIDKSEIHAFYLQAETFSNRNWKHANILNIKNNGIAYLAISSTNTIKSSWRQIKVMHIPQMAAEKQMSWDLVLLVHLLCVRPSVTQ